MQRGRKTRGGCNNNNRQDAGADFNLAWLLHPESEREIELTCDEICTCGAFLSLTLWLVFDSSIKERPARDAILFH